MLVTILGEGHREVCRPPTSRRLPNSMVSTSLVRHPLRLLPRGRKEDAHALYEKEHFLRLSLHPLHQAGPGEGRQEALQ